MTKFSMSLLAASAFLLLAACEDHTEGVSAAEVAEPAETGSAPAAQDSNAERARLSIDAARSTVGFTGAKVTDSHTGTFSDFEGSLVFDPEDPTASEVRVTIRTASVQIEPERLLGHMKSEDFFHVERFPTAEFESTSIREGGEGTVGGTAATHTVTGNLTLRGETRQITFPAVVEVTPQEVRARSEFSIDRKDFAIVYPGMQDDLIKDEVVIRFDVRAPRAS